ncbi:T9SS type A sorting domain-containing protein [Bacteroidota bacterium]
MKKIIYYTLSFVFLVFVIFLQGSEPEGEIVSNQSADDPNSDTPISWFNLDGLPPVGDQVVGGSCYAWAAVYYYLTHLQWQELGWDVNDPAHQFSPAFVYNLTNGGVDNGAWEGENARHDAFDLMKTLGCATMEDMPYDYTRYRTFPSETAFRNGMKFRTLSTHHIETRTDSGLQVLKEHLVAGNLAVMGIYGFHNLNNISSYNNIYCLSQATGSRLYWHEVTVVGYNDTLVTADGIGAFRLINEWGTGWGDNGYFWMSYEAVKHTQTSYGYVMYATDRIGYEPMLAARVEVGHSGRYNLVYKAGYGDTNSPDTLLTFFDFSPMSLNQSIPYPDQTAIVLDLSDMINLIQPNSSNEIFVQIEDGAPNNGRSGFIKSLSIEYLPTQLSTQSLNMPMPIEDVSHGAEEVIDFDYSLSSPQNLEVVQVSLEGLVQLSWSAPAQMNNLLGYRIYINGRLVDTTSSISYSHFLSLRGTNNYDVTALFQDGESLGAMAEVIWEGPDAFGIPFYENYEDGFGEWYHVGSAGIPSKISAETFFEGQYSAGIKTTEFDNTALVRPFVSTEGAHVETWFKMDTFPVGDMGAGGCILLMQDGLMLGTFIDLFGHPGYLYSTTPNNPVPVSLDSVVTLNSTEWYKQNLRYYNGKLQFMLIDSNWDVILNRAIDIPTQSVNQVALFAQGLNNGWNYFDKFSINAWDGNYAYFSPVSPTLSPYALIITEASINSASLEAGDEIAAFDGNLCVGTVTVDGEWPLEMNTWEADSTNPGFTSGNTISLHIWSAQSNTEYYTDITFDSGDGNYGSGLFSRVSVESANVVNITDEELLIPIVYSLEQNYPNPFNPTTTIKYSVPDANFVSVEIFNLIGEKVVTLVNEEKSAGVYEVKFNAIGLPSGIYFYKLNTNGFNNVKKMILMK